MNGDITIDDIIQALPDGILKTWLKEVGFPEEYTVNEFLVKLIDAASQAAAQKNETLEPGQKILGYPAATNGAIARAKSGQLFFPRTSIVSSFVVVDLDQVAPTVG